MKKKGSGEFTVEKAITEALPPGWSKEIRVKKKGGKTRKDPYYIDPENGQVFRSLKEVFRYLGTKDCSKAKPELEDQGPNNVEAGDSRSSLPCEVEEEKVGESKADGQAVNERLKLGKEQVINPNGTQCCTSAPGNTSHQGQKGAVIENNCVEQVNNKDSDSLECQAHVAREHKEVLPPPGGKEVEKHGHKKRKKSRKNKMASLPRRASKRLAGIEADDASLELKTDHQGSLAAIKQKVQTKAAIVTNSSNKGIEKKQEDGSLPLGKLHSPNGDGNDEIEVDPNIKDEKKKSEMTPESSVNDMWMDPCIDFAIKTLTGAIPIGDEKKVDETPQSSLSSSAGNPQSSVELPFGDIWADPCFAFAVKTLTGEIPITDDLSEQQGPQIAQPSMRLDDFRQVNISARHFNVPEKPLYKQQGPVAPAHQNCWLPKFGSNQPSSLC